MDRKTHAIPRWHPAHDLHTVGVQPVMDRSPTRIVGSPLDATDSIMQHVSARNQYKTFNYSKLS